MVYLRCRNCGRYLLSSQTVEDGYCCDDCSRQFLSCINCGGYYQADMGYRGGYCGPECAVQYRLSRYPGTTVKHGLRKELA
jgi:hypothetical protein